MSKAQAIIKKIIDADECEILEFDFDDCFEYMTKMENILNEIKDWDINNKMRQGQFLLSHKLRSKIQNITET